MAQKPQFLLKELGSKLHNLPTSKDTLIKLLKEAAATLSEIDQSPPKSVLTSMQPFLDAIVKPELIKHQDREVKLLVATCICEITRITAPEAPYNDDILKEIFHLIVSTFSGLSDKSGPSFGRRVVILETLARYRSCVVMLDLECDDLVKEMFSTFLAVASDGHPESVLSSMQTIMVVLLEESEEIQEDLLLVLLSILGRNKNDATKAGRRLAMNVIEQCSGKLEPGIKQFLISSMSGDSRSLDSQIDYHEVMYDIYRCAPQVLSGVVPYLTGELLTDNIDTRLKAVQLVGDLFALPESAIFETFLPIFSEFLKRLTDRVVEVRMSVLEYVKRCLLSNPSRAEAPQIISALFDRLLDYDENVRKQVVAVLCDVACCSLTSVPVETVKLVAERLRDKSILVKKYAMERLAEIYNNYCLKCSDGSYTSVDDYDWIPGKILRCFYDKDFRSDAVEPILCSSLFPSEFSVKDKVRHWVKVFTKFDKVEIKALEKILEQKQRVQQEMIKYLSLRQVHQDNDGAEFRKKVLVCFRTMSRCFIDPGKAEENFLILDQLKDANVWKILSTLLDPNTTCLQACRCRDDVLRILGEKHRLYEFLSALSMKCSNLLFNKEYVKEILQEADMQKSTGTAEFILSCMNILVILACSIPSVLSGIEEDVVHLLEDENEVIKEGVLHVLAKAGGTIRDQLRISSSSLDLILERICLEGSRRQAKYAVHALAAVTKDAGLMSLSVLYKRLLDMLKEKKNLPAVLQSLGCIAEIAMPVFETRENEIETFIKKEILEQSHMGDDKTKESWDERSELCSLKIYAWKTLVKSYLPIRDANLRLGIEDLMAMLKNMLHFGEISKDIVSSSVVKAHMKLAGAKSILRLSRHWDHMIPVDLFYLTLKTSEVDFPQVKRLFLRKIHQYIKDRLLDPKYACAFIFDLEPQQPDFEEDKHNLYDIVQMCQQAKARQSVQSDAASSAAYPEFILPYIVHAIAHHSSCPNVDECKDVKSFEPIYRRLYVFLSMLVNGEEDDKSEDVIKEKENISTIVSILETIKLSEDSVDTTKSKNSYGICDLGLSIIKRLAKKQENQQVLRMSASLPPILYKEHDTKEAEPQVNEGRTWLADDVVVSHFESLSLEANATVHAGIAADEDIKDSDTDGNEVPLGKMIKRLRAKSMKARKMMKDERSPPKSKTKNDIDILKMVREMDLDNAGKLDKYEPSSHEYARHRSDDRKRKKIKRKTSESENAPILKRQRSSSAQAHNVPSVSRAATKRVASTLADSLSQERKPTSESMEMDDRLKNDSEEKSSQENTNEAAESDFLAPSLRKKTGSLSKSKGRGSANDRNGVHKAEENSDHDLEPEKHRDADGIYTGTDSKSGSVKKRKRKSVVGLAKCTSKEARHSTADLIDCKIKIWWPMDKQFYEGVVKSYDQNKNKHVIKYDDGDVEVLCLDKERWELVEKGRKTTKKVKVSKNRSAKGLSSEKKKKSSGNSKESKQPAKISLSSKVRGKRTPRKNLRHGQKRVSETISAEFGEDSCHSPGGLDFEPVTTLKAEETDTEEEQIDRMEEKLGTEEDPVTHGFTISSEHQTDAGSDSSDAEKPKEDDDFRRKIKHAAGTSHTLSGSEEHGSDAEGTQEAVVSGKGFRVVTSEMQNSDQEIDVDDAHSSPVGADEFKPSSTNDSEAEISDDEPLGAWKRRVVKSAAGKSQ
ncbi:sister chromatid cohesion protein PDS5 homolog A isoform X2 [Daucus carota subsp. sativus]|uniref:sister chromatid cohesion protein PDS5 homolog A isoform X2 n=1 Tax=Daucus carota subsp. sativus TaxID=79200 RepID=UPI0007EFEF20|nr:PREDICTED: sister chromatid cohesion protein PDS5 homolog A-like isoform X2 [Daucus carota subsp. sativus]